MGRRALLEKKDDHHLVPHFLSHWGDWFQCLVQKSLISESTKNILFSKEYSFILSLSDKWHLLIKESLPCRCRTLMQASVRFWHYHNNMISLNHWLMKLLMLILLALMMSLIRDVKRLFFFFKSINYLNKTVHFPFGFLVNTIFW